MKNENIVVIGRADGKPEIIKDVSTREVEGVCKKHMAESADTIRRLHARIDAITKEVMPDPDLVAEYCQFSQRAAKRDSILSDDLANRTVEEMEKRVEQYHKYLDVGSVLLFEHANYRGSTRFLSLTYPNLGWWPYCFNDKASSAVAWGLNVLCEHSWYRGRRLYLVGFVRFPDLSVFDFNDKASSFIAL